MANRPSWKGDRFPTHTEIVAGHQRRVRMVTCDKCGYPARLLENSAAPLPPEVVAKKFVQRGWSLNGMNVCPRCKEGKPPMSPAARRAAFCAINNLEKANAMEAAQTPREATAADRRRIRDALDTHYDEDAERYQQSWSDKALAAKLDVPARWVTDIRESGGYGPDTNESNSLRTQELEALALELASLQADLLTRFDDLEKRLNALKHGGA